VDRATGKVGGAKNPRKWGNFFDFRAAYADPPKAGARISPVRITLPDGTAVTSEQPDLEQILSRAFGRDVEFAEARPGQMPSAATAEEYWPDMAGLDYRDTVTDFEMPAGRFFDIAVVHLLTTATINRLRALYPEAASRSGGSAPTSSSRPAARMRALRKRLDRPHGRGRRHRPPGHHPRTLPPLRDDHLPQGDLPRDAGILRTAAKHNAVNAGVYAPAVSGGTIRRGDPVTLT
jgi:hypothetical protein